MLKELGLPDYPPLPAGTDLGKVEEIRRTVYVGNLEKDCDPDELLNFFNMCIGEVQSLVDKFFYYTTLILRYIMFDAVT